MKQNGATGSEQLLQQLSGEVGSGVKQNVATGSEQLQQQLSGEVCSGVKQNDATGSEQLLQQVSGEMGSGVKQNGATGFRATATAAERRSGFRCEYDFITESAKTQNFFHCSRHSCDFLPLRSTLPSLIGSLENCVFLFGLVKVV